MLFTFLSTEKEFLIKSFAGFLADGLTKFKIKGSLREI